MSSLSADERTEVQRLMSRVGGGQQLSAHETIVLAFFGGTRGEKLLADFDNLGRAALCSARLASRGWAPTSSMPAAEYGRLYENLERWTPDQVDTELVQVWQASPILTSLPSRLWAVGIRLGGDFRELFEQRVGVLEESIAAAENGFLRAAVSLILNQVEGVCIDVTDGKQFFSKNSTAQADLVDTVSFPGFEAGLAATRDHLSRNVAETRNVPELARHGVAHGRDLGYGTDVAYYQSLVLLAAVVEWGLRHLNTRYEERKRQIDEENAGSDAVDATGARQDRRGFVETRDRLRRLLHAELFELRRHGRFCEPPHTLNGIGWDDRSDGPHVDFELGAGGATWSAWSQSASGYVFGLGADDSGATWYYEGTEPPAAPAPDHATGWATNETPNWSGDVYTGSDQR